MTISSTSGVNAVNAANALNASSARLGSIQKKISTGFNVADAFDNGAIFGAAQDTRSDIAGISAANQQLGGAAGLNAVANAAASQIGDTLNSIRTSFTQLADNNLSSDQRSAISTQLNSQIQQVQSQVSGASYNGNNLLTGSVSTIANADGQQLTLNAGGASNPGSIVAGLQAAATAASSGSTGAASAASYLQNSFSQNVQSTLSSTYAQIGADQNALQSQQSFNQSISDAEQIGLGSQVDANLASQSSAAASERVRQQIAARVVGSSSPNGAVTSLFS